MKLGIVCNAEKDVIFETVATLKAIPGLHIVYIKESDDKLYIVTERVFNMSTGGEQ